MVNKSFAIIVLLVSIAATAQHRGDDLSLQGVPTRIGNTVSAAALGDAYTSRTGDIGALFYNPAGLADVSELQVSISAHQYEQEWRENQVYRPNRMFWTLAFYLEGLYVPDPNNNGIWDYELAQDTAYTVTPPQTGLDPFSAEAADWCKRASGTGAQSIALAYPLKVVGKKLVLSAAYASRKILDFDRNDTYLDPHIGYDEYSVVERVVNDTVRFSWSRFKRERQGDLQTVTAGFAMHLHPRFSLGLSLTMLSGTSNDRQSLDRVGYFDIAKDNRFRFSYDTLSVSTHGESEFNSMSVKAGLIYQLDRLTLGFSAVVPHELHRDWNYAGATATAENSTPSASRGRDVWKRPAEYAFGATVRPVDPFYFSLDYHYAHYSESEMEVPEGAIVPRPLPDQSELRCSAEFRPTDFLSLMAGYRYTTALFVPDGAAIKDAGPAATAYSAGASIRLTRYGRLEIAYMRQQMTYYDSYFSNTNYVLEANNNWLAGYTVHF